MNKQYKNDEERWQGVVSRSADADGVFLYGVRTTGIYCRPICSSRRPNRENVLFFETPDEAERHGFRPCMKCKPSDTTGTRLPEAILQACHLLDEAEEPIKLDALAKAVGLSPHYFHRLFRKSVGITPKAYGASRRTERMREGLHDADQSITSALYSAGYGASSRFYEEAGETLGMTPTAYRSGGSGEMVRFRITRCQLGSIAIASTERGICMVELGDNPDTLRQEVLSRFPNAKLEEEDHRFNNLVERLLSLITRPETAVELPLDAQGTAFQRQVWEALRKIPVGKRATYSDVAEAIGCPTSSRAVARACATNPIAIAIPCHRVVRKNGDLSGYRWGIERKRELLRIEQAEATSSPDLLSFDFSGEDELGEL